MTEKTGFKTRTAEFWKAEGLNHIVPNTGIEYHEGFHPGRVINGMLPAGLVVEVGCGYGRLANGFAPERYLGVDINPQAIAAARSRNPQHRFQLVTDDMPLPKAEGIFANAVLIHIDDHDILPFIERMTQAAGTVAISEIMDPRWRRPGNPPVFNRDPEQYILLMKDLGLYLSDYLKLPYARYDQQPYNVGKDSRQTVLIFKKQHPAAHTPTFEAPSVPATPLSVAAPAAAETEPAESGTAPAKKHLRCAVVIPVGPGHEQLFLQARASVESAFQHNPGPFADVVIVPMPDPKGEHGRSRRRNDGIDYAREQGIDWMFFLDADDLMSRHCFAAVAAHADDKDAVFGLIAEMSPGSDQVKIRQNQLGPTSELFDVLATDPYLSIQMGHFVRTEVADAVRFDEAMDTGEDFKYYLQIWSKYRCCKVSDILFVNRRGMHSQGPRSANGQDWRRAVSNVFETFCAENAIRKTFSHKGKDVTFAIGNPLDLIHRFFMAGRFFECDELDYLSGIVKPDSVILDIGANVGNHVVYYGLYMQPGKIIPIEPNPAAIALLKHNIDLNQVQNVDTSLLGIGLGQATGRFKLEVPDNSNIGAAKLAADGNGSIAVHRLDDKYSGHVDFMKIDVEWMEMDVLRGARETIRNNKPIIFIEIMNPNVKEFLDWVRSEAYTVVKIFPYVNAKNFVIAPAGHPLTRSQ